MHSFFFASEYFQHFFLLHFTLSLSVHGDVLGGGDSGGLGDGGLGEGGGGDGDGGESEGGGGEGDGGDGKGEGGGGEGKGGGGEGEGDGGGGDGGGGDGGSDVGDGRNQAHFWLGVATQSVLAPQLQLQVELTVPSGYHGSGTAHVVVARAPAATPSHSPQYAMHALAKAAQPDAVTSCSASVHAQAPSGAHVSGGGGAAGGALATLTWHSASPQSTVPLQ